MGRKRIRRRGAGARGGRAQAFQERSVSGDSRDLRVVRIDSFRITDEPIDEPDFLCLPAEQQALVKTVCTAMMDDPKGALPLAEEAASRFPGVKQLRNFLAASLSTTGQTKRLVQCIEENYRLFPDYLFARLNYCDLLLSRGEHEKIPEVFEGKMDLQAQIPDRDLFHVTEVIGFYSLLGRYYVAVGQPNAAQVCLDLLRQLDEDHSATRDLAARLAPSALNRLLEWARRARKGRGTTP